MVSVETVEGWLQAILQRSEASPEAWLAVAQMARRTGDRYRDISEEPRERVLSWLTAQSAPDHALALVREGGWLDSEEEQSVFGDTLPPGLHLRNE